MAHTRRTARKSTDRLPVGQLTPKNVPQPQESQPDTPQEASPEPFEIELVVPESPTAQDSPVEEQQPEDHGTENKINEEHPPPSDIEDEKMYRDADEMESFGAESPILTGRLRALLEHLGITTAPRYRVKEVPRSGRVVFKAIVEIFFGSRILCRHKGLAFRTSRSDDVAAWQAITSWICSNKSRLQNSVHYLLPYRKKDQFKAYGVKRDIPRMEMVHHQDVAVELSTSLLTAQHEIETLRAQLRNTDATIRGYRRMVEGQTSDLYASDTDTWTATSSVQSSGKEPAVSSHSPSGSRSC
jgi:hypothetical protein